MRTVFDSMRKVATTDVPVLILGESGTGKEMAAQAIHQRSAEKTARLWPSIAAPYRRRFWRANCLGTKKGAFTGAHMQRKGRIEMAAAAHCSWMKSGKFRCRCR